MDTLKEIRPCDMEKPYIFISYSAKDAALVWEDALRFQQMGYNIWLDEKNLDKTKSSWRNDALTAIRDIECALLVFYVSRNSLVSEACFSELACTVEEFTCAVHFGPVKFIAIDTENIDDIVRFSRVVYDEIRQKDLPKDVKTTQAVTLHKFVNDFFNSNNEKVRVRHRNMAGRKVDYYEEITASFPDSTRVFEEQKSINNIAAEPQEAPIPKEEPIKIVEEEITEEPKIAPPIVEEAKAEPRKAENKTKAANENSGKGEKRTEKLLRAVDKANAVISRKSSFRFVRKSELSQKQIFNYAKKYELDISENDVIALMDTTIFSSGKDGYLITKHGLYNPHTSFNKKRVIYFDDIASFEPAQDNDSFINFVLKNGEKHRLYFCLYAQGILEFLNTLFDIQADFS